MDTTRLESLVRTIEQAAVYADGDVSFPAYLLEQLHNLVLGTQEHDYTEEGT